jgi:SH3-like domain-containing protein
MNHLARFALLFAFVISAAMNGSPAQAQQRELPYWASLSAETANMRAGAGERFPIEWIYNRPGLPVKVIRFHQGWRLVEEPDGTRGWIYNSLLSDRRTALVTGDGLAVMREAASAGAMLRWNLEPGVIGVLGDCTGGWCELDVAGHRGWVEQSRLWGAGEP